jgi:hypothetical protein
MILVSLLKGGAIMRKIFWKRFMAATSIIAMLSVSLSGLPIHATETEEPAAPNTSTTKEVSDEDAKSTSDTRTTLPVTESDPITTSINDANPESVSEVSKEEVPVSTTETQSEQNSTPAPSSENTGISFSCAYKDADSNTLTPSQGAGISLDADGSIDINSLAPAIDNFDFDHASIEYGETTAALSSLQRQTTTDGVTKYSYSTDGSAWTEITGADSATIIFNYKATVTEPQELKLYADCVDETGAAITDGSHKELTVDGTLKLDDATAAPFTFEGYTYQSAKVGDTAIVSVSKETATDPDTASTTVSYSYLTADGTSTAIEDGTSVTLIYSKADTEPVKTAIKVNATCIDDFNNAIADQYTNIELPSFPEDGILKLDDPQTPPVSIGKVQKSASETVDYTYSKAVIGDTIITGLKREAAPADTTAAVTADASAETAQTAETPVSYVYSYTADGQNWTGITSDTTVKFVYTAGGMQFVYEDDDVKVTAVPNSADALPKNAELKVTPVTKDTAGYNYDAYMQALNNNSDKIAAESGNTDAADTEYSEQNTLLYDIAFMADKTDENGNVIPGEKQEYEPAEGAVKISMEFKQKQLTNDIQAKEPDDVTVVHLPLADDVREAVDTTAEATNISADDVKVEIADNTSADVDSITSDKIDFNDKRVQFPAACGVRNIYEEGGTI